MKKVSGTCSMCWLYKPDYELCLLKLSPEPKEPSDSCPSIVPLEIHRSHRYDEEDNRDEPN